MNKTINQLEELQEANNSDELVVYDVSAGTTQKISKKNFLTGTQDFFISASSTVVTGITLFEGLILKIMFTSAISGTDTETALTISYNNVSYNVKVGKQGALANVYAHEVEAGVYTYIQAYTTLELQYDGTQFIILGNPVVLSSENYTIYADGYNPIAENSPDYDNMTSITSPYTVSENGWVSINVGGIAGKGYVKINGITMVWAFTTTNSIAENNSFSGKVSKGDVVEFYSAYGDAVSYFIPHK